MEKRLKNTLAIAVILTVFIMLMTMSMPVNMLLMYMWIIPSEGVSSIWNVTGAVLAVLVFMLVFDMLRSALLRRFSIYLDHVMGEPILLGIFKERTRLRKGEFSSAMADLSKVRGFLQSHIAPAFLDAVVSPVQLAIVFVISPIMGFLALACMLTILITKFVGRKVIREMLESANRRFMKANSFAQECVLNAQAAIAMGMQPQLASRWRRMQDAMVYDQTEASEKAGLHSAITKTTSWIMQVALMGTGTYLMISGSIDGGLMIVAVIIAGKVVTPVQMVVDGWQEYQGARDAFGRLKEFWAGLAAEAEGIKLELPRPEGRLKAESLVFGMGGKAIVKGVSFEMAPGQTMGIIGPSGAGKTTLARLLTGVVNPNNGVLRLDGADMHHWDQDRLGAHIGYLPQEVELFAGTIAENISRFQDVDLELVEQAARRAGIDEILMSLPDGYETVLEEGGRNLPGGLRQRIGLARALFGDPVLLILDEPDSSLDQEGLEALQAVLNQARSEKISAILVTHRQKLIVSTDLLLMLKDGQVAMYGPTAEVLQKLIAPAAANKNFPVSQPATQSVR